MMKKQICEVIAKSHLSHLIPLADGSIVRQITLNFTSQYAQILSSSNMADWYEEAARLLNITSPVNPVQYLSIPPDNKGV